MMKARCMYKATKCNLLSFLGSRVHVYPAGHVLALSSVPASLANSGSYALLLECLECCELAAFHRREDGPNFRTLPPHRQKDLCTPGGAR